jgi:hypothetical protein
MYSLAGCPTDGLGPRILRSLKAACSSRMKRPATAYTVVREQKRTRAISVGERPSAQSSTMCILSLLLGRLSRFIFWMRSLRSSEARVILCIWAAVSLVAGWIWRLYHATGDGRLFNYPVLLSSFGASPAPGTTSSDSIRALVRPVTMRPTADVHSTGRREDICPDDG